MLSHLESENLLTPSQYGFRPKRSTRLAATALFDNIRRDVDRGNLVGAIFIDLSKAFDTLSHSKLLTKLPGYGIEDRELMWFTDYLFERKMTVSYEDLLSNKQSSFTGVPQGSILGLLLFLIYFNDVVDCILNANIIKYADDTMLFFSGKSLQIIEQNLSEDIDRLKKGKSEVMLFIYYIYMHIYVVIDLTSFPRLHGSDVKCPRKNIYILHMIKQRFKKQMRGVNETTFFLKD